MSYEYYGSNNSHSLIYLLYQRHLNPDHVYKITPICIILSIAPPNQQICLTNIRPRAIQPTHNQQQQKKIGPSHKDERERQTLYFEREIEYNLRKIESIPRYDQISFMIWICVTHWNKALYSLVAMTKQTVRKFYEIRHECVYLLALVHEFSILLIIKLCSSEFQWV